MLILTYSILRKPHEMRGSEIVHETGVNLHSFWTMVDRLKHAGLKDGEELTCEAQTLLYLMKLRHNDSNKRLGNKFGVAENLAAVTFKNCMLRHFSEESGSHPMPRLWSQNLDDDQKDELYEKMAETNNVFYKDLVGQFGDPEDKDRKPVVIQIDSTNLLCEKPSDPQCQKKMFYNAKPAHYIKLTNIVDLRGQVTYVQQLRLDYNSTTSGAAV